MGMDLKDYIRVYDDALDKNICRNIIRIYKEREDLAEYWDHEGRPSFSMVNITKEAEEAQDHEWMKIHNELIVAVRTVSEQYMNDLNCRYHWPPANTLEQIRLKHYEANNHDRFDYHVDVGDHDSARRFLVLFFYLNDVEEGGETHFPDLDYKVKPKEGSALLFPPTWMYPHAGLKPVSNDKYIIGTYLHYK